jgi:hypothetical protein
MFNALVQGKRAVSAFFVQIGWRIRTIIAVSMSRTVRLDSGRRRTGIPGRF